MKTPCNPALLGNSFVVGLAAMATLAACYRDPNYSKIVCTSGAYCPSGYECVVEDGIGRCRHSGGDAGTDARPGSTDRHPDSTADGPTTADRPAALDQLNASDRPTTDDGQTATDGLVPSDGQPMTDGPSLLPDGGQNSADTNADEGTGAAMDVSRAGVPDAPAAEASPRETSASDGLSADLTDAKTIPDTGLPDAPLVPVCGNSVQEQGEQCDDGNTVTESCAYGLASCTVCSSSCQSVPGSPSSCGDGKTDSPREQCDDGNSVTETCAYGVTSCTVCNSSCQSVPGATSTCGDGKLDSSHEQCDDGNAAVESCTYGATSCTVCNATCRSVAGATSFCGDGRTDLSHEECDDGNTTIEVCAYGLTSCTICSDSCQTRPGATSYCGDDQIDPSHEQCDDGNAITESCAYGLTSCTVCNSTCHSALGTTSYCGDGRVDSANEDCEGSGSCSAGGYNGNCTGCACAPTLDMIWLQTNACDFSVGVCGGPNNPTADFDYRSDGKFYSDRPLQQGLVDLGMIAGSLRKVPIPTGGYWPDGVPAVANHVYVAMAPTTEPGHYIVFRVVAILGDPGVRIVWVYI